METSGPLGFRNLLNEEFPESGVSTMWTYFQA
jgi:hypothetical protein